MIERDSNFFDELYKLGFEKFYSQITIELGLYPTLPT
jgi:hypothetical protein